MSQNTVLREEANLTRFVGHKRFLPHREPDTLPQGYPLMSSILTPCSMMDIFFFKSIDIYVERVSISPIIFPPALETLNNSMSDNTLTTLMGRVPSRLVLAAVELVQVV